MKKQFDVTWSVWSNGSVLYSRLYKNADNAFVGFDEAEAFAKKTNGELYRAIVETRVTKYVNGLMIAVQD